MYNVCDALFGVIALVFVYFGFQTGSIVSIFFLASGFFGSWAAHAYAARLEMHPLLLFLVAAGLVIGAGFLVRGLARNVMFGPLDRFVGMLLGLALGAMVVTMVFPLTAHVPKTLRAKAAASYTGTKIVPWVVQEVPPLKHFSLEREVDQVKEEIPLPKDLSLPKALTLSAEKKPAPSRH